MLKHFSISILFLSSLFLSAYSQYCVSGGPSSTMDSNVESVTIFGEGGSNIQHTGCPGVVGVQDLTTSAVILNAGSNYTINIQFGTCGGNYSGAGESWIDFNGDQIFDVSESLGTWTGTPPTSISTFNFNVPIGSPNVTTRLRVSQQESGFSPLNPCASFTWGSVMDFSVLLQNGIDCSGYAGNYPSTAINIPSLPFSDSKSTSFCYLNASPVYASPDVFYKFKVNHQVDFISASLCGSNFDTHISIQDTGLHALFYNDDSDDCAPNSEVYFSTEGLDSIYFVVEGYGTDTGTYKLLIQGFSANSNDRSLVNNLKIFPNPAKSTISISGINRGVVNIYATKYQKVLSVNNNFQRIDIADLEPGIYWVEIVQDEIISHRKLVIE